VPRVTLRSDVNELVRLEAFVTAFCRQHTMPPAMLNLVAEECFVNAVEHGSASQIEITLELIDGVVMTMEDDGIAFDPLSAPEFDPATPLAQRRAGGLGIHMVRHLVQEMRYQRLDGRNRLTLRMAK
jgi:serine/threonine-protein kinase RsbW